MYDTISYFHSPCYLQSYFIYIIPFDIYNLIISHCYYHPIGSPFQRRAHLKLVKVLWQKKFLPHQTASKYDCKSCFLLQQDRSGSWQRETEWIFISFWLVRRRYKGTHRTETRCLHAGEFLRSSSQNIMVVQVPEWKEGQPEVEKRKSFGHFELEMPVQKAKIPKN